MDEATWRDALQTVHAVRLLAASADDLLDLDGMLDAIERADSVGSVLDPTSYMRNHEAMAQDRETIKAVRALARLAPAGEEGTSNE